MSEAQKAGKGKRKKVICKCWCMKSFAIDSIGAAGDACVGDGVVGEAGRAMRSSVGTRKSDGETNERWMVEEHVFNVREEPSAIEDASNSLL
jgi:hypothetical protein